MPRIVLIGRAPVERDRRSTGLFRDASRVEIGEVRVIDSHPGLDRHGDVLGGLHGLGHDTGEQFRLPRKHRTAALAGDLRNGATEIEVDVVNEIKLAQHANRSGDGRGINAV